MVSLSELYRNIQALPPSLHGQVNDFVEFLKGKYAEHSSYEDFWELIGLIENNSDQNGLEKLVQALAEKPDEALFEFDNALSHHLSLLDGPAFFSEAAKGLSGSNDSFLYARCYVVAQGEEYFYSVLSNPSKFPDDWYEDILYAAATAYEQKHDNEYNYLPPTSYETGTNAKLWGEEHSAKKDLSKILAA